ncbi:MAG: sodium ion-translocating decarboxylase subunit beta [Firmicutes bacterium]|nr:sodium ion-translocating decarboxylase subunit beta [Bacillota bacterium]
MNFKKKKYFSVIFIFLVLIAFVLFFNNRNVSMGMIGGSDGPTSIFLVSRFPDVLISGALVVTSVVIIGYIFSFFIAKSEKYNNK